MQLYRAGYAPLVVFTGGGPHVWDADATEGKAFLDAWKEFGLPVSATCVDTRATNTHENAVAAAGLLGNAKKILLVTSVLHMRRAPCCSG